MKNSKILKYESASKLGPQATLIIPEGDSAKTFALEGLGVLENGRSNFGIYPVGGKILNVRQASDNQIEKSKYSKKRMVAI